MMPKISNKIKTNIVFNNKLSPPKIKKSRNPIMITNLTNST